MKGKCNLYDWDIYWGQAEFYKFYSFDLFFVFLEKRSKGFVKEWKYHAADDLVDVNRTFFFERLDCIYNFFFCYCHIFFEEGMIFKDYGVDSYSA